MTEFPEVALSLVVPELKVFQLSQVRQNPPRKLPGDDLNSLVLAATSRCRIRILTRDGGPYQLAAVSNILILGGNAFHYCTVHTVLQIGNQGQPNLGGNPPRKDQDSKMSE